MRGYLAVAYHTFRGSMDATEDAGNRTGTCYVGFMKLFLSLALLIALLAPAANAAEKSMVYIEYRFIAVNIKPGSFEASVRKLWRYTDSYAQLEDAPKPQIGIHGLLIRNAPNSSLVNLH